jgi:DNA-binding MarR family transcriptional regulator
MTTNNHELQLLEAIQQSQPHIRQRDLAAIAGLSLGMTNAILKRLAEKGLITARKINSRNIRYAVTPEGMEEILHRSYGYFKRTIKHVVRYRNTLEQFTENLRKSGFDTLILIGSSDLDFIIEHAAHRAGLTLRQQGSAIPSPPDGTFLLYGEAFLPESPEASQGSSSDYLSRLLA